MHEGVKVLLPQGGESTLAKVSPSAPENCQEDKFRWLCRDGEAFARSGDFRGQCTWTQVSLHKTTVWYICMATILCGIQQHLQGAITGLEVIPELIDHHQGEQRIIRPEWRNYDILFCKHAAVRRNIEWSVVNPVIYAWCFMAVTRNTPRCELCLVITYNMKDCCSQWDIAEYSVEGHLKSTEQTMKALFVFSSNPQSSLL